MGLKKDSGKPIHAVVSPEAYEKLNEFCRVFGQSKTVAIERALEHYCSECLESYRSGNVKL